jgi:hypothetical protein
MVRRNFQKSCLEGQTKGNVGGASVFMHLVQRGVGEINLCESMYVAQDILIRSMSWLALLKSSDCALVHTWEYSHV